MSVVMYVAVATLLFGSGAGLVWFKTSNEAAYDRKAELEVEIQILESHKVEIQAQSTILENPDLQKFQDLSKVQVPR